MKAIDTNVLVRLITNDDRAQTRKARDYIKLHSDVFVSQLVLCETFWVLQSYYEFSKSELLRVLENVLRTAQFTIENADVAWLAVHEYKRNNIDFSDCLIGAIAKHNCCNVVGTFDKKVAKNHYFELIGS